jgi:hypothetical protein
MLNEYCFLPYVMAIAGILEGDPVRNLGDIRQKCTEEFLSISKDKTPIEQRNYTVEQIVSGFVADAENKILMGIAPEEAYKVLGGKDLESVRNSVKSLLREEVNTYFSQINQN